MTVPSEPEGTRPAVARSTLTIDAIRFTAFALPLTVLVIFLGIIWLIGSLVPYTHANSQKTGRQALAMIRALAPPRQ